jgi:hypothetical protein
LPGWLSVCLSIISTSEADANQPPVGRGSGINLVESLPEGSCRFLAIAL